MIEETQQKPLLYEKLHHEKNNIALCCIHIWFSPKTDEIPKTSFQTLGHPVIIMLKINIINLTVLHSYFFMSSIHFLFPISLHHLPSLGMFVKCGISEILNRNLKGNISHGPYSQTACWAKPFTSERHTAGCGLHRVIAFGFRGIQKCFCTIINKNALAGCQQLFHSYGDKNIKQIN